MANYETVIYEKAEDRIYRLTLNRPEKLNALSQKLLKELDSVMDEYESNADASVLIIRGAGVFSRLRLAGHAASRGDVHRHQRPDGPAQDDRAMAAAVGDQQTHDRAGAGLLPGGRHGVRRPLRYRVRQRRCAVRASRGPFARYPADDVDVAGADGSTQNERVFFHRRLHVGERSARMALGQSRFPQGQTRGRDDELCAPGRDGAGGAADAAQGGGESLSRYHRDSGGRAVGGRHRRDRASDRHGEELDEGEPRGRPQGSADGSRPPIRQESLTRIAGTRLLVDWKM